MKIVVDDKIPYLERVLERYFDSVVYLQGDKISPADVADADALLVRTRTHCNASLLRGSRVRFIATATIGHDHIDKDFCAASGIQWANAPGCNAYGVVQYVLASLALLSNGVLGSLSGKTLGIIGVGEVGKRLAAVAPYLGLRVLLNDPPRARQENCGELIGLDALIEQSDFITLHVPLSHEGPDRTYRLVDADFLQKFGSPKVLINASRGEVVDEDALLAAIEEGRVSHAVLDVWCSEPSINQALLKRVDIGTPHIAGYTLEGKSNGTAMAVNSILRFFWGDTQPAWLPAHLPHIPNEVIFNERLPLEDAVKRCILSTYDIKLDDANLRQSPSQFERLRGGYRVRRELSYFCVHGVRDIPTASLLRGLTFKVL